MARTFFATQVRADGETAVTVEYSISGGCPAHMGSLNYPGHPAEAPEVEIVDCWLCEHDNVKDAPRITPTDEENEKWCQDIIENHEDDDGEPDIDWRSEP